MLDLSSLELLTGSMWSEEVELVGPWTVVSAGTVVESVLLLGSGALSLRMLEEGWHVTAADEVDTAESLLAAAAAMVSKSMGLEMRFSDEGASEMLEVTLAEVEFMLWEAPVSFFDMVTMGELVSAICCPPVGLHSTKFDSLLLSLRTEFEAVCGFEGACMMTVFCIVGKEAIVCCGRISTLFCRVVKAMAAAVAAALAFDEAETTVDLVDGTTEVMEDVFNAVKGSRSTRVPLTIATWGWWDRDASMCPVVVITVWASLRWCPADDSTMIEKNI